MVAQLKQHCEATAGAILQDSRSHGELPKLLRVPDDETPEEAHYLFLNVQSGLFL